jgi:calcineurin-like phosphoesterase family protein
MKTWIVSDTHFYHGNIVEYCGRPDDHNERMWAALEESVQEEDTLIHMGDVVWHGKPGMQRRVIDRLPGRKKILLQGNHDHRKVRNYDGWDRMVPIAEQPLVYTLPKDVCIYLAHRPREAPVKPNSLVIHGHIHEKGVPVRWHGTCMIVNACVEQWDYRPILLDDLVKLYLRGPACSSIGTP